MKIYSHKKSNSLDQRAFLIAHDMRSPLSAAILLLNSPGPLNEQQKNIALKALDRALEVTEELLEKRRVSLQKKLTINIKNIIQMMAKEKKYFIPQFEFDLCLNEVTVVWNSSELLAFKRILCVIFQNAVEAVALLKKPEIKIRLKKIKSRIQIEVFNNGPRIPKKVKEEIFQKKILSKKPQGNGVGLYQASLLIKKINGSLKVQSEKSRGTLFKIIFKNTAII